LVDKSPKWGYNPTYQLVSNYHEPPSNNQPVFHGKSPEVFFFVGGSGVDVAKVWEISTGLCRGAEISFAAGG